LVSIFHTLINAGGKMASINIFHISLIILALLLLAMGCFFLLFGKKLAIALTDKYIPKLRRIRRIPSKKLMELALYIGGTLISVMLILYLVTDVPLWIEGWAESSDIIYPLFLICFICLVVFLIAIFYFSWVYLQNIYDRLQRESKNDRYKVI
jgi:hypothetical protein